VSRRHNIPAPGSRPGWGRLRYVPLIILMVASAAAAIVGVVVKL
jgi:hypothetical protein